MRKLHTLIFFMMIAAITLSFLYIGCKSDDEPTSPSDKAQDYSPQKQPYSYVTIEVLDPDNNIYYIVKVCLKHNYGRGNPTEEITIKLTTSHGFFDQNNDVKIIELKTTNYVQNGEECVSAFLYYSDVQGQNITGVINAQTNYGDGATHYISFGGGTTPGSQYDIRIVGANPPTICGNGKDSSVITIELVKDNSPVPSASINVATEAGCLSQGLIVTDATGRGSVTLISDSALFNDIVPRVTFTYTYLSGTESKTEVENFFVTFKAPGWYFGSMTTDEQTQYPTVTVYLYTCNGANAPDGERITFTTSQGEFIDGSKQITLSTVGGRVSVKLTANENVTTYVSASYVAYNCDGTIAGTIYAIPIPVNIVKPPDPTPTLTPTPEPYRITVSVADSEIGGDTRHFTTVTAQVQNSSRSISGLRIKFESEGGGCINPEYAYTNAAGFATTTLQSGLAMTKYRKITVIASYTDEYSITYLSEKRPVTFSYPGYNMKVSPESYTVPTGASTMITAHLSDFDDADVENANIEFSISGQRGSFSREDDLKTTTIPTDAYGDATVLLTSAEAGPVYVQVKFTPKDCDGTTPADSTLLKTLNITFN